MRPRAATACWLPAARDAPTKQRRPSLERGKPSGSRMPGPSCPTWGVGAGVGYRISLGVGLGLGLGIGLGTKGPVRVRVRVRARARARDAGGELPHHAFVERAYDPLVVVRSWGGE